jgi:hypothetical protein
VSSAGVIETSYKLTILGLTVSSEGMLLEFRTPMKHYLTYRLVGEIIARFEKRGFKLVALKQMSPSQASPRALMSVR